MVVHHLLHSYLLSVVLWACIAGRALGTLDPSGRWMKAINRISALLIWIVACYMAVQLIIGLS